MIVGSVAMVGSIVLLMLTSAMRADGVHMAYAHMAVAALVAAAFVLSYLRTDGRLRAANAGRATLAANTARFLGLVWAWGALGLAATYATGLFPWREWPHFLAASVVLAGLCLAFANMLDKDAAAGREDATMLKLGDTLGNVLLGGMVIVVAGLLIDGKMTRFLTPRFTDWPANNIFFFGAIAMALISGYSLLKRRG